LAAGRQFDALYFLMLVMACLIALLGLLTNSPAVIIGAMLISPLMGPILACGLAFTLADWPLGRKALRNAVLSVFEAVAIAALATLASPLREVTPEILARTRPNLMDLLIAFFSGLAGTLALTSRKGALTIIPGVAIATAVMPPLATTGFGLATGQWEIGWGGFTLFFTNLMAIVISAAAGFFLAGFRPHEEAGHPLARHRALVAAALLLLLSIPLVRTLHAAVQQARLRREIGDVLRQRLSAERQARLASVDFAERQPYIQVDAVVHTSRFITRAEEELIEALLSERLRRPARLDLRQLRVETQDLVDRLQARAAPPTPAAPPGQVVGELQGRLESRLAALLTPAGVEQLQVVALGRDAAGGLHLDLTARVTAPADPATWRVALAVVASEQRTDLSATARLDVGQPLALTYRAGGLRPSPAPAAPALAALPALETVVGVAPDADPQLVARRLDALGARTYMVSSVERVPGLGSDTLRVRRRQTLELDAANAGRAP
jgi:uncharacterized hydrophobic protein (TIGR00271 family)